MWRDEDSFEIFLKETEAFWNAVSNETSTAKNYLTIANNLDDLLLSYEKKFGPIEDPLYFFIFAQVNTLFLYVGKEYDELGTARIGYVINGLKEALTKHLLYPSFDEKILHSIEVSFLHYSNDYDKNWYIQNKLKFCPIINEE